jgi:hypothetical protein
VHDRPLCMPLVLCLNCTDMHDTLDRRSAAPVCMVAVVCDVTTASQKVCTVKGLSDARVEKILAAAAALAPVAGWTNALSLGQKRQKQIVKVRCCLGQF